MHPPSRSENDLLERAIRLELDFVETPAVLQERRHNSPAWWSTRGGMTHRGELPQRVALALNIPGVSAGQDLGLHL